MPNTRNNPTSGCDPTPHRPSGTTRKAFAAAAATRARCDPAYTNDDIAVRRHATFCQTLEAELDHALRGSGLDEFGIEYDRPLPLSAARRPSAHHTIRNAAVAKELATIRNTPTELLLKGIRPIDKTTTPRIFSLGEAVTDLRNILNEVDPAHIGLLKVEDANDTAQNNLEEAGNIPFMGMCIGDNAKVRRTSGVWKVGHVIDIGTSAGGTPFIKFRFTISTKVISAPSWDSHIRPLRDDANVSSRRPADLGTASCAPRLPTRVVTREADELKRAGAAKPRDWRKSHDEFAKRINDMIQDTLEKILGPQRKAHRDDDLAVLPAKPVEPSTRAILSTTPVKAPTIRSSNRASTSSKRATGGTGNFEGGYQPGETEGYVYWAAFATDDLRAPRCDRGSRGFPSPQKGARGPPQRDKRHWANRSYQVELPINDGEPPSQHLWNNHDGAGIKIMPQAPQVYENYNTMGTGTDPSLIIMISFMVQLITMNWATLGEYDWTFPALLFSAPPSFVRLQIAAAIHSGITGGKNIFYYCARGDHNHRSVMRWMPSYLRGDAGPTQTWRGSVSSSPMDTAGTVSGPARRAGVDGEGPAEERPVGRVAVHDPHPDGDMAPEGRPGRGGGGGAKVVEGVL
ncbi:hypothetical protein THAOC_36722 [Thalassiosira oceanica]|uniref:Uncharacterized protein n=1 Tax=Thalassiosira oceanica TaxID=159749 RepID=K0R7R3_THAOC|nr:hypothetical protein THAOC_36722 [Thalassiosira oceanica]|eukprot:EJK44716.1 hypothetical protein THAOC_36722 [Thalassiosira oceanica]